MARPAAPRSRRRGGKCTRDGVGPLLAKLTTSTEKFPSRIFTTTSRRFQNWNVKSTANFPQGFEASNFWGAPKLFGERGFAPTEQRSARPDGSKINSLTSGYQAEGHKNHRCQRKNRPPPRARPKSSRTHPQSSFVSLCQKSVHEPCGWK